MLRPAKLCLLVDCFILSFLLFGRGIHGGKCPLNPKRQIHLCLKHSQAEGTSANQNVCGEYRIQKTLQCLNKIRTRCVNRADRMHTRKSIVKTIEQVTNAKALCNLTQGEGADTKQGCVDRDWEDCTNQANIAYQRESGYSSHNAPSLVVTCSYFAKMHACTQMPMRSGCSADVRATTRAYTKEFLYKKCGKISSIPTVRQRTDIVEVKLIPLGRERTGNTENRRIHTNPVSPPSDYVPANDKEEEEEEETRMSFDDEYRVNPGAVVAGAARSSGNLDSDERQQEEGPENSSPRIVTWSWAAGVIVYLTLIRGVIEV